MSEITQETKQPALVFAHGWAMQDDFFQPLIARLGDAAPVFHSRNYFGTDSDNSVFNPDEPWIGIGHSYGFMRLASEDLRKCRGLISLNGFTEFCGDEGTKPAVVKAMIRKLKKAPDEVVNDFRRRCGESVFESAEVANSAALEADLEEIAGRQIAADQIADVSVLALASADDEIVPVSMAREQFDEVHICPGGGHLLGYIFPYWCSLHVMNFVSALESGPTTEST